MRKFRNILRGCRRGVCGIGFPRQFCLRSASTGGHYCLLRRSLWRVSYWMCFKCLLYYDDFSGWTAADFDQIGTRGDCLIAWMLEWLNEEAGGEVDFTGEEAARGFFATAIKIGHGKVLLELVHNNENLNETIGPRAGIRIKERFILCIESPARTPKTATADKTEAK